MLLMQVDALRKEVSELKQLVQQLSNQQKAVTVVNTPKVPSQLQLQQAHPFLRAKPGWMYSAMMAKRKSSFMGMSV
ncbi:hypothetical protein ABVN80_16030 [Acinetobacter baumannii]